MLGPGSRRITRCVRFALYARTDAANQLTKRAARADPGPALLAATEIAPGGCRLPRVPPSRRACTNTEVYRQRRGRAAGSAPLRSREAQGLRPARAARLVI